MNDNLSFSVLTANFISLLLLCTLDFSNKQRRSNKRDMKIILNMMIIAAISNITDCYVYYCNSSLGIFYKGLFLLSGSWLFLGNVLIIYN